MSGTYERRNLLDCYRQLRVKCARDSLFMTCGVVGAFDLMSSMCGPEYLLMGMASDGPLVQHMAHVYATVTICFLEIFFSREGAPGGLWVWDDLGYKNTPFMSPAVNREILFPAHKWLYTQAGMGLLKLKRAFGDRIALIGGMDERVLETNNPAAVGAELTKKLTGATAGSGYLLLVDHSVSSNVTYETYRHFVDKRLQLRTY